MTYVLVAFAGALGALARYGIGLTLTGTLFPWATLTVNVVGSALLGLLLGAGMRLDPSVVTVLGVGFLGAFTTFSTFSAEALLLLREGRGSAALAYVAGSLTLALGASAAGYVLGRSG